jgi:hypothetical protein
MKQKLVDRKIYIEQCNSNEGTGLVWCRLGIWKLRGKWRAAEKEDAPYVTKIRIWSIYY